MKNVKWFSLEGEQSKFPVIDEHVIYLFDVFGTIFVGRYLGCDGEIHKENAQFAGRSGFLTGDVSHWCRLPHKDDPEWVKFCDKKPENDELILWKPFHNEYEITRYSNIRKQWDDISNFKWMKAPIPPPRAE